MAFAAGIGALAALALATYADAGHSVLFEQADEMHRLLVDEIVPLTYQAGPRRR